MKLIRIDENNKVLGYHNQPDMLSEEERANGIMVEAIPEPEQIKGKQGVLMYNPNNNSVYVEYVDRPLTTEEQMQELKDSLDYMILQNEGLV